MSSTNLISYMSTLYSLIQKKKMGQNFYAYFVQGRIYVPVLSYSSKFRIFKTATFTAQQILENAS